MLAICDFGVHKDKLFITDLPEVSELVVLQLEPGRLLPQPTEAERVLIRLVQYIRADY